MADVRIVFHHQYALLAGGTVAVLIIESFS
jgi:hypothetical protein